MEPARSIQPLMKQNPAIPVMIQALQFPSVAAAEQEGRFGIGIQLIGVTYKRHQRIKTLAHISMSGHHVKIFYTGQVT